VPLATKLGFASLTESVDQMTQQSCGSSVKLLELKN